MKSIHHHHPGSASLLVHAGEAAVAAVAAAAPEECTTGSATRSVSVAAPSDQIIILPVERYITSDELRPTDILCGRGNYEHPGNTAFLRRVETRKSEYLSCGCAKEKSSIANEVYMSLCGTGSVRFLQLVSGKNRKPHREGKKQAGNISYWREMDKEAISAKIKQALRQKRFPKYPAPVQREDSSSDSLEASLGGADVNVSGRLASKTVQEEYEQHVRMMQQQNCTAYGRQDPNEPEVIGLSVLQEEGSELTAYTSGSKMRTNTQCSATVPLDSLTLSTARLSTGDFSGHAHSGDGSEATPLRAGDKADGGVGFQHVHSAGVADDDELLNTVRIALETTRSFRATQSATRNDNDLLQELGRTIFSLAASNQISNNEPSLDDKDRQEKLRTHQAKACKMPRSNSNIRESLLEYGYPMSFVILVDCLINVNSSSSERFHSFDEVEGDLLRMLNDPNRYLFESPSSFDGGRLCFHEDKVYGRKKELEALFASVEQVLEMGNCGSGFVVISGYSGCGKNNILSDLDQHASIS